MPRASGAPALVFTPYGRPTVAALHAEIVAAKQGEPLAPVTVVVPTNSVGVATRRLLASGELGPITGRGVGVVGVNFLTVFRLAELLAAPTLAAAGRRPVSTPVVAAAVRAALAEKPGLFAPVAEHPATEEALAVVHRELSDLAEPELDVLARQGGAGARGGADPPFGARTARRFLVRRARPHERGHRDRRAGSGAPRRVRRRDRVSAAAAHAACVASVARRGSGDAGGGDRRVYAVIRAPTPRCSRASPVSSVTPPPRHRIEGVDVDVAVGTHVITTSDPDDEVRAVVRGVVDAMRAGTPLERMAILYASPDPYPRLLHEHLDRAGIAHNGATVRALDESVLGARSSDCSPCRTRVSVETRSSRSSRRFRSSTAPGITRPDRSGNVCPGRPASWVGSTSGTCSSTRTPHHSRTTEPTAGGRRANANASPAYAPSWTTSPPTSTSPRVPVSWSGKATWAHGLVGRFLGAESRRGQWPVFEQEAARRVESALDRLGGLDEVEAAPTLEVFRRTLELELTGARERVGRLGEGILVGPVGFALGADLDHLFVCGLAEGVFPARPGDDPLLSDDERAVLGGALPLRSDRIESDHRALLAALASTTGERVLCFPRGDLRRSTEHVPSRFLLDTAHTLGGLRALDTRAAWCTPIASYIDGVARVEFPSTAHEYDVRSVLATGALDATAYRRGRALLDARRSDGFTRFDGNLADLGARVAARGPTAPGVVVSPTRLEKWVGCPHAYFMQYVLHIDPVEQPEGIVEVRPIDRGSIVHEILDQFVGEGGRLADGERLHDIADAVCARLDASGLSGRRLLWEREQRIIHDALDAWLVADDEYRREFGLETLGTEHRFGPIELTLGDGRIIRFRGSVDRVDRAADGRLFVFDYKTGSPDDHISEDDPLAGGTRLQLPVYGIAARALAGASPETVVAANYWFVGKGADEWVGYDVDADLAGVFDVTLQQIVTGIEAGCFPAPAARARSTLLDPVLLLRPRRAGHCGSLSRLDAQGGGRRARRVRRAGGRRMTGTE